MFKVSFYQDSKYTEGLVTRPIESLEQATKLIEVIMECCDLQRAEIEPFEDVPTEINVIDFNLED